jgi:hypothetical protein
MSIPSIEVFKNLPDQPWTIEADMISTIRDIPIIEAIDLVIVRYLKSGDTRAMAWWFYEGHCPSKIVLNYIACMLQPGSGASPDSFPFELITKSRKPKRGRPKKGPEPLLRDWLIFRNVFDRMSELGPGSYDSAIKSVAELDGLDEHSVKRAYDTLKAHVQENGHS